MLVVAKSSGRVPSISAPPNEILCNNCSSTDAGVAADVIVANATDIRPQIYVIPRLQSFAIICAEIRVVTYVYIITYVDRLCYSALEYQIVVQPITDMISIKEYPMMDFIIMRYGRS